MSAGGSDRWGHSPVAPQPSIPTWSTGDGQSPDELVDDGVRGLLGTFILGGLQGTLTSEESTALRVAIAILLSRRSAAPSSTPAAAEAA